MTVRIDQFHPTVSAGSAISNHMLDLQQILLGMGHPSEIFCEQSPIHFTAQTRHITEYESLTSSQDVLLAHFSLHYSNATMNWLKQVPGHKVLVYHNITPHTYFKGINPVFLESAYAGREQLPVLQTFFQAGWGDSAFNVQELATGGWDNLDVLPIIFNPERVNVRPDRKVLKRWQNGLNILFVGRVSPNKRLEDIILTFYYLKRFISPDANLLFVGSTQGMEPYLAFLQTLIKRLGLSDILFTGHVDRAQWVAYYQCADIYLSMSEHEGFGVPFLECMHFGIPIVAYKAAAVPETLGDSGLLVTRKAYASIAELMGLLISDETLRTKIIAKQRERLQDFLPDAVAGRLQPLLNKLGV